MSRRAADCARRPRRGARRRRRQPASSGIAAWEPPGGTGWNATGGSRAGFDRRSVLSHSADGPDSDTWKVGTAVTEQPACHRLHGVSRHGVEAYAGARGRGTGCGRGAGVGCQGDGRGPDRVSVRGCDMGVRPDRIGGGIGAAAAGFPSGGRAARIATIPAKRPPPSVRKTLGGHGALPPRHVAHGDQHPPRLGRA